MGWSIGFDKRWNRDIGYGVPAICDSPGCNAPIDRGIAYACAESMDEEGHGCGLFFCGEHIYHHDFRDGTSTFVCKRCHTHKPPYKHPKPDVAEWLTHKLNDESWAEWRSDNPEKVAEMKKQLESKS